MCINVVCVYVCALCVCRASPACASDSLLPLRTLVALRASPLAWFQLVMTNWNRYSALIKICCLGFGKSPSRASLFFYWLTLFTIILCLCLLPLNHYQAFAFYLCSCLSLSLSVSLLVVYWCACYVCACCVSVCMSCTIATSTTLCLSCLLLVYWLFYLLGV